MTAIFPGLEVLLIPTALWSQPLDVGGLSLEDHANEISGAYRRLFKGGNRAQKRTHLLVWYDHLQAALPVVSRSSHQIIQKSVEPTLAGMWLQMLSHLALEMGARAMGSSATQQPFLPAIWHPSVQNSAPHKIPMDVQSHLKMLVELLSSKNVQWVQNCATVLKCRQNWFNEAKEGGWAIIETTTSVYASLGSVHTW